MKTILILMIFCSTLTLPALGELDDTDLDKIRLIIQEEIKPIKADIVTLQTQMATVKTEIKNLKESMNTGFANVQKDFDRLYTILIYFITVPLGVLAIGANVWGILAYRRSRKEDTLQKQIETLTEKMETFTQEIETLKQQRIVSS